MTSFINKFKMPTLLGLGVIILGIVAGIFLIVKNQSFLSLASPNLIPKNITLTNIEDESITISWQTSAATASFITFGIGSLSEQTALDDRDGSSPRMHSVHYITLKNLQPKTTYSFKIISGKLSSDTNKFTTASPPSNQNGFQPVIGYILDSDKPLDGGIVYLSISGAVTQSAVVKNLGNFLIPISLIRKSDLSEVYQPTENDIAKLTVLSDKGQASALFKLNASGKLLPPIKLGQNVDLTTSEVSPTPTPTPSASDLDKYDLNGDGSINAADYAIVLQNFGRNPQNKKADLNGDGIVDQKDLDLMQKKINQ